jgi:hypothetical protein
MLNQDQIKRIQPKLLLIQVIAAALILGALAFATAMSVMVDWENLNDQVKMLTLFAGVSGLFISVMSIFVPKIFASHPGVTKATGDALEDRDIDAAVATLTTESLIRYAMLEGAVFLNLMVLIIEPHLASLVVAGIGLLLMIVLFPRQSRLVAAIEDRA